MDDDRSGTLDIQEFWKAMKDFRVSISQDECRRLFDLFDLNDDGALSYDELILHIKG
jgi:Ca2+-binding EF-hand superfamily protein